MKLQICTQASGIRSVKAPSPQELQVELKLLEKIRREAEKKR